MEVFLLRSTVIIIVGIGLFQYFNFKKNSSLKRFISVRAHEEVLMPRQVEGLIKNLSEVTGEIVYIADIGDQMLPECTCFIPNLLTEFTVNKKLAMLHGLGKWHAWIRVSMLKEAIAKFPDMIHDYASLYAALDVLGYETKRVKYISFRSSLRSISRGKVIGLISMLAMLPFASGCAAVAQGRLWTAVGGLALLIITLVLFVKHIRSRSVNVGIQDSKNSSSQDNIITISYWSPSLEGHEDENSDSVNLDEYELVEIRPMGEWIVNGGGNGRDSQLMEAIYRKKVERTTNRGSLENVSLSQQIEALKEEIAGLSKDIEEGRQRLENCTDGTQGYDQFYTEKGPIIRGRQQNLWVKSHSRGRK